MVYLANLSTDSFCIITYYVASVCTYIRLIACISIMTAP